MVVLLVGGSALALLAALLVLTGTAARRVGRQPGAAGGSRASRPVDVTALFRRRELERRRRARPALPALPVDDVPPAGLAPLLASPRAVRLEAARGIRELEDWLAGRPSSA